jgi:general secretion pathway protein K
MSMADRSPAPATTADGFIVVAVLWILAALAGLVSVYAIYVSNTAIALAVNDDPVQAEGLVSAGVELAVYQMTASPKGPRPTHGEFTFRLGRANVAVDFRSETARIDLNAANKKLLAGLFATLGARENDAEQYADRIIGWRTTPSKDGQDAEASLYRAGGLDYGPRGAPFAHVDELWLVLGLPPPLVERALPNLTVFSGRPEINPLIASPEVVAAIPGMSPDRLNGLLAERAAAPPDSQAAATPSAAPAGITTEGGDAARVTVRIAFDNGRRLASEVVILVRARDDEPYHVLSWRDDVDGKLPAPQPRAELRR